MKHIPIEEARKIAKVYEKDIVVIIAWDHVSGDYYFTTAGVDALYAHTAVDIRDTCVKALGLRADTMTAHADKRHEHKSPIAAYVIVHKREEPSPFSGKTLDMVGLAGVHFTKDSADKTLSDMRALYPKQADRLSVVPLAVLEGKL